MAYDVSKVQLVWNNVTLQGFGREKINIRQDERNPSMLMHIGIFGEFFSYPNTKRGWIIETGLLINSPSYKMLLQDNLFRRRGTLIIRDLNPGAEKNDIFNDCIITSIGSEKDGELGKVSWYSTRRNLM